MPDTVKIPLLGNVPKGGVVAGGLAAVGVAGYLWYKHQKGQAIAAQPAAGAAGGYGYGAAYGYAMSSYGYGYGPAGYGFGQYGAGGFGGGGYYPSPYGYGTVAAPQTNAQWSQNATTALVNQGYTGTAVIAALGAYIGGKPVQQGSSEDTTIQGAIAIEGYPPQPGTGGYPPAINYSGSNPGQTKDITVPNVIGKDANQAASMLESAGLTFNPDLLTHGGPGSSVKGKTRVVYSTNPKAGTKVTRGTFVHVYWHYHS